MRAWSVWAIGLLAYIVAVFDRTTLGVSGIEAADRFGASPGVLSTFVVLQVLVYAGAQVPAGLLLDRYGSRLLIAVGAGLMASGQLALALTESLPAAVAARAVLGLGDAFTFISVLRLVPVWFAPKRVPLITQLTGISGQLGQVLSAVPFLAVLHADGWQTAYLAATAMGVLLVVLALTVVRDVPPGMPRPRPATSWRGAVAGIGTVWARPGTRLGFFTHMGTQFSVTVFALMWGVPYVTTAQGMSTTVAGGLLTLSVVSAITSGVVIGLLSGRYPHRRSRMVLAIIGSNAAVWTVVLALPGPAPLWLVALLVVVISVGGPGSMVGFDFARTFNPSLTLGTAAGLVNMGGFLASVMVMQMMGIVIGALGGYSFDAFRAAWCAQYAVWAFAALGIVVTRRKARRILRDVDHEALLLEGFEPRQVRQMRVLRRLGDR